MGSPTTKPTEGRDSGNYKDISMGDKLDELCVKLDKLMADANLREEDYLPSLKRLKVLKETIEAALKAKSAESLYHEEQKLRKEVEEKLAQERKQLEYMMNTQTIILQLNRSVLHEKSSLEREIKKCNLKVLELNRKLVGAVFLQEKFKKERDDLEIVIDNALLETQLISRQLARLDPTPTQVSRSSFADFTYSEILEAIDHFNRSRVIVGEGCFGVTYKGLLRHTEVAIKMLSSDSLQDSQEFQNEVDTMSRLRHPNIVTLIGVCDEHALVYEYLPNGNLDDRLACKDNSPPLLWQTRIHIAAELCSVIMFLHSCQPASIIHGSINPANVLLDARLSCKLSGFGIYRAICNVERSMESGKRSYRTDPKGTFSYMDPEFLSTGVFTPKSDVYSLGIILLRLLTGKSALGIIKEVQYALDKENLNAVLDPSAGDWPFAQAKQLALLGLRCCEMQRKNRPDLEADVWRVLEPMRFSCGSSSLAKLGHDEHGPVPPYFLCPISKEVMRDPHTAADGFTYEADALKSWLSSGHDTSPMTNLKLKNHTLIPNNALRSAIQEWRLQRGLT